MPGGRDWKFQTTIKESRKTNKHIKFSTTEEEFVNFRTTRDKELNFPKLLFTNQYKCRPVT